MEKPAAPDVGITFFRNARPKPFHKGLIKAMFKLLPSSLVLMC
jgi:hypothetical protein